MTTPALANAPTDVVHISGMAYGADGAYVHTGDFYSDMPVYTLDHNGTIWSLYQRNNGRWYVDFNEVSDDYDGTIAIGPAADLPWLAAWDQADDVASPVDSVVLGGAPYTSQTTGVYTFTGATHNGKPVFEHQGGGRTWSLYQRSNGRWCLDFNDVSDDHDGTVALGPLADMPYEGVWDNANMAVSSTAAIEISGAPYTSLTTGTYTFDGQTIYNNAPVFQRQSGNYTLSVYKRSGTGRWYLDFDDVDEQWAGTIGVGAIEDAPTRGEWDNANMLVVDSATTLLPQRGRYDFGTFAGGSDCREIEFAVPFDGDDVRMQVSIDHANGPGVHDAATLWVEAVDRYGARVCARETSNFDLAHDANLSVSYLAYRRGAVIDGDTGRFEDTDGFTGTGNHCNTVSFHQTFAVPPIVQATITHPNNYGADNDAMSVWLEEVGTSDFKVCVRETSDMSADHGAYAIDWLAHEPGAWPFYGADESGVDDVPAFEGTTCFDYLFDATYTDVPQVFVTADHRDDGANHDAVTVWLEALDTVGFTACVRELASAGNPGSNAGGAHNDQLQLAWTAVGNR
ncbi:hypothetical protein DB30_00944 [Enhygromyxa salina]|uniref:Uncharacterized protein n=1 Tax=Enhygromyxa salina TaxID=215803 RepID=A0A0C2CYF5_9BACT|nr:hypothetical protein [Enhygromyxa salina]KIG12877.1 hypothetical protein DB30_00944 [Enhygromyxa salina]